MTGMLHVVQLEDWHGTVHVLHNCVAKCFLALLHTAHYTHSGQVGVPNAQQVHVTLDDMAK